MSKININFNDNNYEIDRAALSGAKSNFVSHLGTIAGSGLKIVIDGVVYNVDSTKLDGSVVSLATVLNNLNAGGDVPVPTDSLAPGLYQTGAIALYEEQGASAVEDMMITSWDELISSGEIVVENGAASIGFVVLDVIPNKNEYGFYYNVPYDYDDWILTFHEDGSIDEYYYGDEESFYSHPANTAVYSNGCIDMTDHWGWGIMSISSDGKVLVDENGNEYKMGIPAQLEGDLYLPKDGSVTSISEGGFKNQVLLTRVHIPDSVTSIDDRAFSYCDNLASINIPEGVTSIGDGAFDSCLNLISIDIPSSVTYINEFAFISCASLASITVNENNEAYYSRNNCLIERETQTLILGCNTNSIPEGVTSIGGSAFYDRENITSITIPNSVTSINDDAFNTCIGLINIIIPDSVTNIGDRAFVNCSSLANLTIGNGVTHIGHNAFGDCTSLTNVNIPNSVTSIGWAAFSNCTSLTNITISDGMKFIDGNAFSKCTELTSITFNGTVEQWNAIEKHEKWNNHSHITYVQCSDGTIAL